MNTFQLQVCNQKHFFLIYYKNLKLGLETFTKASTALLLGEDSKAIKENRVSKIFRKCWRSK